MVGDGQDAAVIDDRCEVGLNELSRLARLGKPAGRRAFSQIFA
jgi:hypothetical protein